MSRFPISLDQPARFAGPPPKQADVVVIGGGIIGASTTLELAERGLKVALFGATPEVLSEVVRRWEGRGVRMVYARDGYVREEEHPSVAREVAGSGADLLLVAMGTPKSERFIARHMEEMGVPLCMGVGGCFDVMAGVVRRAPEVVSRWHLEWAWRLSGSPRARFQRAVVDSARFVSAIARGERLTASSRR